jgi:hypothetical protein
MPRRNNGNRHQALSSWDVLVTLVSSTPAWLRALSLISLVVIGFIFCIALSVAVFYGRAVEFWPPKIAAYEPPIVQNCRQVIAIFPTLQTTINLQVDKISSLLTDQLTTANEMQKRYIDLNSTTIYGMSAAASAAKEGFERAELTRNPYSLGGLRQDRSSYVG